ncbi:type IV pilus modification protein PilV [Xanthomonas albilineans]|uniref:type IV pilus modification protein PilV n=1 Tax=Xanthomonas albilineans TaxID=29447 RepID=UPI0005F330D1|nr:type IV pilus modification protein PilV [Xanthomonas albilineans]PPU94917.1 type IV pilus modification protein PilV [Xanthomonas albilineans]
MKRFDSGRHMAGVSLIEVMISVLILGVGMLGVAAMQTTALRNNQSALQRSQIVMETYAILDAMRANRAVAIKSGYNTTGMLCNAPTATDIISSDQALWLNGLKTAISGSLAGDNQRTCGAIACAANPKGAVICTITVQWDDSRGKNAGGVNGSATQTLATVTEL